MCVVSTIIDNWQQQPRRDWFEPFKGTEPYSIPAWVPRHEFDTLKREVESLRELIKAAKVYDEKTGQPDCEMKDKVDLLKRVADALGVDLDGIVA